MRRITLAFLIVLGSPAAAQQAVVTGLTAAPELARVYDAIFDDAIFDARFADVLRLLAQACGPAPEEACRVLGAVSLWWELHLDPNNLARDAGFQSRIDAAIAAAEAWTEREPERAEA